MKQPRFLRIERLLGEDALTILGESHVVIVGMGAVGSYALEALARSGVGYFRVVDFDVIGITNINRQLLATESTLGEKKVEVARKRVLDINPNALVEPLDVFAHEETLQDILAKPIDLLIDAIDSLTPKLALLEKAWKMNIPTISSMGAALRTNPTAIETKDLMDTHGCPLAKQVRTKLRRRGVGHGITAIFSSEPVSYTYKDPELEEESDYNEQILDRGRKRRVLGSLPTITGMFGLRIAQEALFFLLNQKQNSPFGH